MTDFHLSTSLILPANVVNKVAIITGGASGVGAQIVKLLSAYGAHPWFCDINTLAGEALVASTPNAHFIYADVADWEGMYEFFRDVYSVTRQIDLVFANAGHTYQNLFSPSSPSSSLSISFSPTSSSSSASLSSMLVGPISIDKISPTTGALLPPALPLPTLDNALTGVVYTAKLALHFFRRNYSIQYPSGSLIFTASPVGGAGSGSRKSSASSASTGRGSSWSLPPPSRPQESIVVELMRSLGSLFPSQHGISRLHVASVSVAHTNTAAPPPPPPSAHKLHAHHPHITMDAQLFSFIALALVVMASNPATNGKSWLVMDAGRCAEVVN